MNLKLKKYLLLILIIAVCLYGAIKLKSDTIQTNADIKNENLSNKKIGWGIKRNDNHEQPDVGTYNKNILEKYNRNVFGKQRKKICIFNI